MAERGGQPDKDQRVQDERREDERREDEGRERENEGLRARLDKLSNALDAQQRNAHEFRAQGACGKTASPPRRWETRWASPSAS